MGALVRAFARALAPAPAAALAMALALAAPPLLRADSPGPSPPAAPAPAASAQDPKSEAPSPPPADDGESLEARKREIERLKAAIAVQQQQLDELTRQLEALSQRLALMEQRPSKSVAPAQASARAGAGAGTAAEPDPLARGSEEEPLGGLSATDFPGSFRIPGTESAIKFGGMVWVSLVETLKPLGSSDQFLTYSIPVGDSEEPGQGKRLTIWAGPSRINIDYRTLTSAGLIRAFIEGDFAGNNGTYFRLRFAFLQFRNFLFGQTWSTFSDHLAEPEDIDFEGINAENVLRQPQFRYTWNPRGDLKILASIENPEASITGGEAVSQVPDFVGRIVESWPNGGHIQGALFAGNLRGQSDVLPDETESVYAYGASVSGVLPVRFWNKLDRFLFQANGGAGVAHYINDLNSAGGQDGVFDPETNDLHALTDYAFYVTYEHHWTGLKPTKGLLLNDLRSSLIWGFVDVQNLAFQPADAYHRTNRLSLNVLWTPIPRLDFGAEYIWGRRLNKDGEDGTAAQFQFRTRYLF